MDPSKRIHCRVIVDECVSAASQLMKAFRAANPEEPFEWVFVAQTHPAIPDAALLNKVLGRETILLTMDRILHNRACQLGLRSYTIDPDGNLTRASLPGVSIPATGNVGARVELRSDYAHAANPIATALKQGMTEKNFKRYRTQRRRIRSYFGTADNMARIALTIGAADSSRGLICGFFLAVSGFSGAAGLRASEGYAKSLSSDSEGAFPLLHALREVYLLQLESVPVDLFVIPAKSHSIARLLLSGEEPVPASAPTQALGLLLGGIAKVELHPCLKGRFHDAMVAKLRQVTQPGCNELVTVDFSGLVNNLARPDLPRAPLAGALHPVAARGLA